jgi:hypothetical protein
MNLFAIDSLDELREDKLGLKLKQNQKMNPGVTAKVAEDAKENERWDGSGRLCDLDRSTPGKLRRSLTMTS